MKKEIESLLLLSVVILIFGCSKLGAQESGSIPIEGKIVFESNREALNDQMEYKGRKWGVASVYLFQQGNIQKISTGCGSPRWSPDETELLCVEPLTGNIRILNASGKVMHQINGRQYAYSAEWLNDYKIIYTGSGREGMDRKTYYLTTYEIETGKEEVLYKTTEGGTIRALSLNKDKSEVIFGLVDRLKSDMESQVNIAELNIASKTLRVIMSNAFNPVLLEDQETLIVATNRYPNGEQIYKDKWGAVAKYNIRTKNFKVIRPTGWIRSMCLSRNGKYLLVSEDTKNRGVAISIYALSDFSHPIYQMPAAMIRSEQASQDINPDWIEK